MHATNGVAEDTLCDIRFASGSIFTIEEGTLSNALDTLPARLCHQTSAHHKTLVTMFNIYRQHIQHHSTFHDKFTLRNLLCLPSAHCDMGNDPAAMKRKAATV